MEGKTINYKYRYYKLVEIIEAFLINEISKTELTEKWHEITTKE